MSPMLMIASLAITAALALYTAGVFRERARRRIDAGTLALFWAGLACDTTGTTLMTMMARSGNAGAPAIHGITGAAAIVLMLFHAGWAALVWLRGRKRDAAALERERVFHRFSTAVWLLWLVPYLIGLLVGVPMIHLRTVCAVGTSVIVVAALAWAMFRPQNLAA